MNAPNMIASAQASPPSVRELLRRVLWFSLFPLVIGVVQWGMDCLGERGCSNVTRGALHLAAAWLAFTLWLMLSAWIALRLHGPAQMLRLWQQCPHCQHRQPIINTVCIACERELGLPPGSRATFALVMQAFLLFELMLLAKPLRFLF